MKPTFQLDTRGFNEVLKEIVRQSSRDAADVVNSRLFHVMLKAIQYTKKADAERIAWILGQVGTSLEYTRKGDRLRKGKRGRGSLVLKEDSFAARIVNARLRDYAGPDYMIWGNALETAARKLIARRVRSLAFIKSGWLWALKTLGPLVKSGRRGNPDKDAKTYGQAKGLALPARAGDRMAVAIAENSALIAGGGRFQSPGPHNPLPVAEAGLRRAFAEEKAEMEKHLREKYIKAARRAGATAR